MTARVDMQPNGVFQPVIRRAFEACGVQLSEQQNEEEPGKDRGRCHLCVNVRRIYSKCQKCKKHVLSCAQHFCLESLQYIEATLSLSFC